MKKHYLWVLIIATLLITLGWVAYIQYIKVVFTSFEDRIRQELNAVHQVMQTPDEVFTQNCKYDLALQTDDFIKAHSDYQNYTWDDDTKTANIQLNDSTQLSVKRGGCKRYDCYITLESIGLLNFNDKQTILKKVLTHAQKLFDHDDYNFFVMSLQNGVYTLDVYDEELRYVFEENQYCYAEIYMRNHPKTNRHYIKIGFSKC